jgi:hypothetical protein
LKRLGKKGLAEHSRRTRILPFALAARSRFGAKFWFGATQESFALPVLGRSLAFPWPFLQLPCLAMPCHAFPCLALPNLALALFILALALSCLALYCLALALSRLAWP